MPVQNQVDSILADFLLDDDESDGEEPLYEIPWQAMPDDEEFDELYLR